MKFDFVGGLEKTSKVVGILASISFGIAVITACTRFTKNDIKILLGIIRTKKESTSEPEQPKPQPQPKKTSSSKKPSASKEASVESVTEPLADPKL